MKTYIRFARENDWVWNLHRGIPTREKPLPFTKGNGEINAPKLLGCAHICNL